VVILNKKVTLLHYMRFFLVAINYFITRLITRLNFITLAFFSENFYFFFLLHKFKSNIEIRIELKSHCITTISILYRIYPTI